MLTNAQLAKLVLGAMDRSPTSVYEICSRAQVSRRVADNMRRGSVPKRAKLLAIIAALGMRLTAEGELEWDDSVAGAVAHPSAMRDLHAGYRQRVYDFIRSLDNMRFAVDAYKRDLITRDQLVEIERSL